MRELGFSRKDWMNYLTGKPKLQEDHFFTFRLPRKDTDWKEKETVRVVYQPRSKDREVLGTAKIIFIEPKFFFCCPNGLFEERIINDRDAKRDGFRTSHEMYLTMVKMHGKEKCEGLFNKLSVRWIYKRKG